MLSSLFGSSCTLDLKLEADAGQGQDGGGGRKTAPLTKDRSGERAYIFCDGEDVCGVALLSVRPGNKLEHQGIKVELVGRVEMVQDKSLSYDFFCIAKDLEPPGTTFESKQYSWKFKAVDLQSDTYCGANVRLRYFVRMIVIQGYMGNISKEVDLVVQNLYPAPTTTTLKMEVGITDCLRIEFEFDKSAYHLRDCIIGKVYFCLVRIKIKYMELDIVRKETTYSSGNQNMESETLTKFEIMDGAPVKEECIPVRLYLTGFGVTPSFKNVQNKFSVKYFLDLVLVDEEDRRYFKSQEVNLFRNRIG